MTTFLQLPTTLFLTTSELVIVVLLVFEVLPVHRRAGLLACFGLALAASASVGLIAAEVALFWAFSTSGAAGSAGVGFVMLGMMLIGTFLPPLLHAVGLAGLGLAMARLLQRLEGTDEAWSPPPKPGS